MSPLLLALTLAVGPAGTSRGVPDPELMLNEVYPARDRATGATTEPDPAVPGARLGVKVVGHQKLRHFKQYLSVVLARRFPVQDGKELTPPKPEGCELLVFERPWRKVPRLLTRAALPGCSSLDAGPYDFDTRKALVAVRHSSEAAGQLEHRLLLFRYDGQALEPALDAVVARCPAADGCAPTLAVERQESGPSEVRVTVRHVDRTEQRRFRWDGKAYVESR